MLTILHTIAGIWEHTGGPAESVPMLSSELVKRGNAVTLATLEGPLSIKAVQCSEEGVDLRTYRRLPGQFSLQFSRAMPDLCREADIVHGHGVWLQPNWSTGRHAKIKKKPLVISPRGSLEPDSLRHSSLKKKIAGLFFDNKHLRYASLFHAASVKEYASIRAYGLKNPVAIIPNGINIPAALDSSLFMFKYPELRGKKILLFLSRLSWEKGLPLLAEVWAKLHKELSEWHLVIAGQGTRGYEKQIKTDFDMKALSSRLTWTGLLNSEEKWSALAAADLFVLPTHTENFGIAIAEALASGVPVITTHGAPWGEIVDHKCGWWIPTNVAGLTSAIREAVKLSDMERHDMGERGRALMKSKYSWGQVAEQMESVYGWILHGGAPPGCVRLD